MADVNIGVNDSASVAEDITLAIDQTPTGWVADVISLSEYVDVDIAGYGGVLVEDGHWTQDEISAVGLYTKALCPRRTSNYSGYMNVSISGTFVGTVVLQRSFDKGATWHAVSTYTSITETSLTDQELGVLYRLGCPSSWTSGTAICRLGNAV